MKHVIGKKDLNLAEVHAAGYNTKKYVTCWPCPFCGQRNGMVFHNKTSDTGVFVCVECGARSIGKTDDSWWDNLKKYKDGLYSCQVQPKATLAAKTHNKKIKEVLPWQHKP